MSDSSSRPGRSVSSNSPEPVRRSRRKRKRPPRYESPINDSPTYYQDFDADTEGEAWDRYYGCNSQSDAPFSGFDIYTTIDIINTGLKTSRNRTIDGTDVIVEIGHGKHPLVFALGYRFRRYYGIEFSSLAIFEAIKLYTQKERHDFGPKIEFLCAKNMSYFHKDGTLNLDLLVPPDTNAVTTFVKGCASVIVAKSTLDYISSRLSQSSNSVHWDDHPRIPPFVVDMFDSLSLVLADPISPASKKNTAQLVFVEPDNDVKFKDHIGTLVRALYTATFKINSPARFLRISHILRRPNDGAICYIISKSTPYKNFQEMRQDFWSRCKGLYPLLDRQDNDWLLPTTVPPKWDSDDIEDLECIDVLTLN